MAFTRSVTRRIPFEEAITEKLLFKIPWDQLSGPQQSALRIFYGLPLDRQGLMHYSMFTERATYDSLGFIKECEPATDYAPIEHDEAVIIIGRRGAKTSGFLSFILAYEALLGGHTAFASPKQEVVSFIVAQKLDVAQAIIRDFIEPLVSQSKLLEKEIIKMNSDGILFKNGHRIAPAPPVVKNFRYFAIPCVALDECAFWYKDAEAANPDYEVVRAVEPAQAQFPNRKLIAGSTIWSKEGIIWEAKEAGIYGKKLDSDDELKGKYKDTLVLQAPTPAMENPLMINLGRKYFERRFKKDPEAYKREILNQASEMVSGMFPEEYLKLATKGAPTQRAFIKGVFYVGAIDPAFRGDSFTFTLGHYDKELGFIQDLIKSWNPKEMKLNPAIIMDEIALDLKAYDADVVYSDQYQLESLQQIALDRGFSIIGMDFTAGSKAKIFGSFLQLLRNDRIKLLKHQEQFQQFLWMQRQVGHGGYVRISAPSGKHDDLVTVTVLCASMAIRFEATEKKEQTEAEKNDPYNIIMKQLSKPPAYEDQWL